ncbi:MAG TPA: TRAP transporter substrate-binding protein [Noviherbaspirillum sp.]|nr:TRAP transporter substrate-binding protein [Noviherbaspirillum sp.]
MIKKRLLAALLFCTAAIHSLAAEPEIKLRVFGSWDMLSQFNDYERPFWTEKVPAMLGERIAIELTPFNKAGLKGSEIVRLMNLRAIDIGTAILSYISEQDPIVEGIDLAGLAPDAGKARRIADAFAPAMSRHFERKYGIRALAFWPYPAQMLHCNGPIASLDDLRGKKVRISLRTTSDLLEAFGAVTLSIPFDQIYGKIKEGAVDCVVTGTLSANAARLYEVTTHLYNLPLGWSTIMLGMTQASWDRLSPAEQKLLLDGVNELSNALWQAAESQTSQGLACNAGNESCRMGQKGAMKLIAATPADRDKLQRIVPDIVVRRWFERCGVVCAEDWTGSVGKVPGVVPKR